MAKTRKGKKRAQNMDTARRAFLKKAAAVPPAVSLLLDRKLKAAEAQAVSMVIT